MGTCNIYIWRRVILRGTGEVGKADCLHNQKGSPKGVSKNRKGGDYIKWKVFFSSFFQNMFGFSFGWLAGAKFLSIVRKTSVFEVFFSFGAPAGATRWSILRKTRFLFVSFCSLLLGGPQRQKVKAFYTTHVFFMFFDFGGPQEQNVGDFLKTTESI